MRMGTLLVLSLGPFLAACAGAAGGTGPVFKGVTGPLFDVAGEYYNYAPSLVRDEAGIRHVFYCSNRDPGVIRDYIYHRTRSDDGAWSGFEAALAPAAAGWDSVHVCDPDVVAGVFRLDGEVYRYALFYLGCDTLDNTHNQVGVALAKELAGPWIRLPSNPLVPFPANRFWGVGQPSAVSLDGGGKILLFYTKGDATGSRMFGREVDLADAARPRLGPAWELTTEGLSEPDGRLPVLYNGALAHDGERDLFYLVRDTRPSDPREPSYISVSLQAAVIPGGELRSGTGRWRVLGMIGPAETGFPRNHNTCVVKDVRGRPPERDQLEIAFTTARTGPGNLWTYRIYEAEFDVAE